MEIFIEYWNPKQTWLDLSKEEKTAYVSRMGPAMEDFTKRGVDFYAWGMNEDQTPQKSKYNYYAICTLPNKSVLKDFQDMVVGAGWYDYFEQLNISGENIGAEAVIGKLLEL